MKCPSCSATIGALDKICPYCGAEVPTAPLSGTFAPPEQVPASGLTALSICDRIQEDLAALALKPPTSRARSFFVGLITPPTFGLAFIVSKALEVFGRQGESPNRLVLSIDENIRKGKTSYKNDSAVATSLKKFEAELAGYHVRRHSSHRAFWLGFAIGVVAIVGVLFAAGLSSRQSHHRKSENLQSTISLVQAGELSGAVAIVARLPEDERRELAERDSFARIAVDILDGRDKEALELSKGIPDLVARAKAENFIALRMLDRALQSADYAGALDAARWVTPEEEKAKAEDRVRASQATALISADKMDKAKEIMANIHSESTRSQLERLIESKLPNPKLNGF